MMSAAYTLGRILVPIPFIVMGIQKFLNVESFGKLLAGYVPLPAEIDAYLGGMTRYVALGYLIAAIEVICGVMVLVGLKARWGALVLIVFGACTIVFVDRLWEWDSAAAAANQMRAVMNLSILGALLLIVAGGSGGTSVDGHPTA